MHRRFVIPVLLALLSACDGQGGAAPAATQAAPSETEALQAAGSVPVGQEARLPSGPVLVLEEYTAATGETCRELAAMNRAETQGDFRVICRIGGEEGGAGRWVMLREAVSPEHPALPPAPGLPKLSLPEEGA